MTQLRSSVLVGLVSGVIALHLAIVGLLPMLHQRWIIVDTLSLGHAALAAIGIGAGAFAARQRVRGAATLLGAMLAGTIAALPLAALAEVMLCVNLRWMFIALSPDLLNMLTFGIDSAVGLVPLVAAG